MNLFKCEFKKTLYETLVYYPDLIVSFIVTVILFFLVINTGNNKDTILCSYVFWILATGVLSESSITISTEKQLGTLQNLLIKPYSILYIIITKTIVWFIINLVKSFFFIAFLSLFYNLNILLKVETIVILIIICFGILGLSLILSALTLMFTKVASFITIISYLLLLLSGSIISIPNFLIYTNPLSYGTYLVSLVISNNITLYNFFILLFISTVYFIVGVAFFKAIFKKSKQFSWTY
ncbi:MAG: ABC transporter [Candidatus Cloacimonadota bacterium]|nr:MAG: ABC transporter [Candidatus Cloacimonadota bacterium]PIE79038.1 MAG: ABC transporter [Candidatus Delongbacteria bacterium]